LNLTRAIANTLDIERKLTHGRKARLSLLDHEDETGYQTILSVKRGWNVSDESKGEGASAGQLKLEIAELGDRTREILTDYSAVTLLLAGNDIPQIYKVANRHEPIGEMARIWNFSITPTGELGVINE
jgi:hypothetical protein